ncbi:MAG: hypothetical protein IKP71_10390, partial [Candidatus Riflebacteria bacterium]|nr:hypothetical protein [Candidatus Riflebacteria bacterium]
EKAEEEYLKKLANDSSANQEDRNWAAANLNENYKQAMKDYNSRNYRDALISLEKAANDPNLNTASKIEVMQKLTELYGNSKDKENWNKWMERMFKEMMKLQEFSELKAFDEKMGGSFTNFSQNMEKLEEFSKALKNSPEAQNQLVEELKKAGYEESEAKEMQKSLLDIKYPYEENNFQ